MCIEVHKSSTLAMCPLYLLALPDLAQKNKVVKTGIPSSDPDSFESVMSVGWCTAGKAVEFLLKANPSLLPYLHHISFCPHKLIKLLTTKCLMSLGFCPFLYYCS